jgi:hypothetical protein
MVDAFTDLLTADNYNISRFFSPDMDIRLIRLLERGAVRHGPVGEPVHDAVHRHDTAVHQGPHRPAFAQPGTCDPGPDRHGEKNFLKRPYRASSPSSCRSTRWPCWTVWTVWRRSARRMRSTSPATAPAHPSPPSRSAWNPMSTNGPNRTRPDHRCSSTWAAWIGCRTKKASAGCWTRVAKSVIKPSTRSAGCTWRGNKMPEDLLKLRTRV